MALVAVPGEWRSTSTAPGTASARKPGACRMPPSSAASWAAERRCRRPARLASVPARDRCGRVPVAAPGPRRLSGTARPRHGTAAGAVAGRLPPSAQVSAMRPGIGDRGSGGCLAGPCRDPPSPHPLAERLSLRLAGGSGRCSGHLEVFYNGTWGRVCASGTSSATAAAACRQLGCGDGGKLVVNPTRDPVPAWLAWVRCEEGARSLWHCPSAPWHLEACSSGRDAYVACDKDGDGTSGTPTPSPRSRCPDGATCTGNFARPGSPPVPGWPGSPSSCRLAMSPQLSPPAAHRRRRRGPCRCQRSCAWSWGCCCAWPWAPWPCRRTAAGFGAEVGPRWVGAGAEPPWGGPGGSSAVGWLSGVGSG